MGPEGLTDRGEREREEKTRRKQSETRGGVTDAGSHHGLQHVCGEPAGGAVPGHVPGRKPL